MTTTLTAKGAGNNGVDESTPLLVASGGEALSGLPSNDQDDDTPLPKLQIALLCYVRLIEPIAFFSIFPFINKMIFETGTLDETDVGFYSGLIESLFSLTQMIFMIPWGRAADRFGRKPILVGSLAGVSIATTLFGFSTQIWHMIFLRCCAGVFAGTVVTVRAMISENSTPKTQARAFSWYAFASNGGIFLGPLIGILSNPADQYPGVFGRFQLFKDYPYALPTLVTGCIGASATIISALFIKETLATGRKASNNSTPPMSTWQLIKYPGVTPVIVIYGWVMLLALAYTAVAPVFWFTAINLGGLGLNPFMISMFLAASGLSQTIWTLLVFTPLQHRIGSGGILRVSATVWPLLMMLWPLGNFFLKQKWTVVFWTASVVGIFLGSGVSMAFTAVQLALNDIAPSHTTLGTLNAIALTVVAGVRAIAPALFTSIFATGAKTQVFGGYLIWVVLVALTLALTVVLRWLPEKAEGRLKKASSEDEVSGPA